MPKDQDHQTSLDSQRGVVSVRGADAVPFLQGLITIDIERITPTTSGWGALLTPQGRWLHDFFVIKAPSSDGFLLDCEHARSDDLIKRLTRYRLRARVDIDTCSDYTVAVAFGETHPHNDFQLSQQEGHTSHKDGMIAYVDPRASVGGVRLLVKTDTLFQTNATLDDYTQWRIRHVLPQGTPDFVPERSLLLDNNVDSLHGIDWHKGCYIGQEVTARMHHRGKKKRALCCVPVVGDAPSHASHVMRHNGALVGEMRHVCGDYGLANVTLPFDTAGRWRFDGTSSAFVLQP